LSGRKWQFNAALAEQKRAIYIPPMTLLIDNLAQHPQLINAVAQMIYDEFWVEVVDGMSVADLVAHLKTADAPRRMPVALIALVDGQLAGCVNLIESDDKKRAHLRPWLAAMVVRADLRGQHIGSKLVNALLADAQAMGIETVYFGTDGPGFYERLGAVKHEHIRDDFAIMKFELLGV
jgi:predicted N-acetyltransferase YhbS